MNYGFELSKIRKGRRMTQSELAEKLGWSQPHVSRIESGKQEPKASEVEDILYALNATPKERALVHRR